MAEGLPSPAPHALTLSVHRLQGNHISSFEVGRSDNTIAKVHQHP